MAKPSWMSATSGANPPTKAALLCRKHNVKTPRRKVVEIRRDEWGSEDAFLSCGHHATGKGKPAIGESRPCHSCRCDKAEELEAIEIAARKGQK